MAPKKTAGSRRRSVKKPSRYPKAGAIIADEFRVQKKGGRTIVEAISRPRAAAPQGVRCKVQWVGGSPYCFGSCKVSSHWCHLESSRYGNWVHYRCRCGPPLDEPTPDF